MGKKMKRTRRSRGKENCNWEIYEKNQFSTKEKEITNLGCMS